ncbi:BASS family bile acid:Na+ symporter [Bradyrhizobium sp. USDA 377]
MRPSLLRLVPRGPTLLALGVLLGLAFPALADLARPLMPTTIFLIVLGTLLRIDSQAVIAALRRPSLSVLLPAIVMVVCPLLVDVAGRVLNLDPEIALAIVLAVSAPPSSGTAAVARMLGLDGAVPLVVTVLSMVLAPITVPLLASWFGGLEISALELALRLALLIGSAEGVAFLVRRHAAPMLAVHGAAVDGTIIAALLVFAVATMAGIRAQIVADVQAATLCLGLALACNIALQAAGVVLLPGNLGQRLTVGLILGNRNVGLVWSALGAAASPRMALYFAATQFPIYLLPRLIETLIGRDTRKAKP